MVVFSVTFRKKIIEIRDSIRNHNEKLIYGLLDLIAKEDFEQNYKTDFYNILKIVAEKYNKIEKKLKEKNNYQADLIRDITLINHTIAQLSQELHNINQNKTNITKQFEEVIETYLATLALTITRIQLNHTKEILQLENSNNNILKKIRNTSWIRKMFLGISLLVSTTNKSLESDAIKVNNIEKYKSNIIPAQITNPSLKETNINYNEITTQGIPTPPKGYTYWKSIGDKEPTKITGYTPTEEGLDSGGEEATGRTSTQLDATNNYDGVAVDPELIPYGSLIYIENVGWKIADDTGSKPRRAGKLLREKKPGGKWHIDIRFKYLDEANTWGVQLNKHKIHIFLNKNKGSVKDKIIAARNLFQNRT